MHNQIRCWFTPTVSGLMGPLTTLDGERVRVLESRLVDADSSAAPGEIVGRDARPVARLSAATDALRVLRTEPAPRASIECVLKVGERSYEIHRIGGISGAGTGSRRASTCSC